MNRLVFVFLSLALFAQQGMANLTVFVCEPEWASLLQELGGDRLNIQVALTAQQDPHHLQAKPSLIASIRRADMLVCSGAQLEIGWLPLLLRRSGNSAIQVGQPGNVMTALLVRRLEVPLQVDRAQGDVHPEGNPHVHLKPANISRIARVLGNRLAQLDAENQVGYAANTREFLARWKKASRKWKADAASLRGMPVIVHHTSFSYLVDFLGLDVVADLEPKPGLPPSSAHLASLLAKFSEHPPAAIIRAPYADAKPSEWLSEKLHVPAVELPYTVGGLSSSDLFEVMDKSIQLLKAVQR